MLTTDDIAERLREQYNYAMSVYDYGSYIRLTNGSAVHYVDIEPSDDSIQLRGERYGETIHKDCDRDLDALVSELQATI